MPSTQKRLFAFSAFLWHCVLVAGLLAHSSCANQEPKQTNTEPAKKEQAANDISKDSLAPPIVIPITPANRPKIIKAGNPIITIDSSGIGTPFLPTILRTRVCLSILLLPVSRIKRATFGLVPVAAGW